MNIFHIGTSTVSVEYVKDSPGRTPYGDGELAVNVAVLRGGGVHNVV